MRLLLHILINTLAVLAAGYVVPGIVIDSFMTALIVAIVLGVVNAVLKPILIVLTLPVTIITLGLFIFVINALMVMLVSRLVPGFGVNGFLAALLFSLVMTLVCSVLEAVTKE